MPEEGPVRDHGARIPSDVPKGAGEDEDVAAGIRERERDQRTGES